MDGVGAEWPFSTVLAAFGGWCESGLGGSGKRGVEEKRWITLSGPLCRCLQFEPNSNKISCLHEVPGVYRCVLCKHGIVG